MYNAGILLSLKNNTFASGRKVDGTIVSLIGVSAGDKVSLDPGALGVELGGNLRLPASAYANWGVTVGTGGYGIRDNAGAMEFKNSGGAWAAIASAAASAGGWTDDGTIVRLDTGTDAVAIGGTTSATSRFFCDATTGNIFNDAGADIDFRIESDLNANHLWVDAGLFGGVGGFGFGIAAAADAFLLVNPPAFTVQASSLCTRVRFASSGGAVTVPAGTCPIAATLYLSEPNLTAVGTIDDAYTLRVAAAPTEGTRNGAIWATGPVRFDSMPTSAAGLPVGTLWNNAGVVNIA